MLSLVVRWQFGIMIDCIVCMSDVLQLLLFAIVTAGVSLLEKPGALCLQYAAWRPVSSCAGVLIPKCSGLHSLMSCNVISSFLSVDRSVVKFA